MGGQSIGSVAAAVTHNPEAQTRAGRGIREAVTQNEAEKRHTYSLARKEAAAYCLAGGKTPVVTRESGKAAA